MHSPLEQYLEDVSTHLSALPPARRNDELQEVRQHLLNAVLVNREMMGQTEDEAAHAALEQFGASEDLGASLVRAWRREDQKKSARHFWKMAAGFAAVLTVEGFVRPHVIVPMLPLIVLALLSMGWKRLTPLAAPAWWAYQSRPASPAQCWLATARNFVLCVLLLFAGMTPPTLHLMWAVGALITGGIWLRWHWDRRRDGREGPVGAA